MVIKDIIHLMKAVQETDFDCFELKDQDFSLKLERHQKQVKFTVGSPDGSAIPNLLAPALNREEPVREKVVVEEVRGEEEPPIPSDDLKKICSPLVGIYRELPPDRVIKKGDFVKKGTPVCLIEAMKLMNEVIMPRDGEILSAELSDGDTVEYDQVLFTYK